MKSKANADPGPTPWPDKYGIGGLSVDATKFIASEDRERVRRAVHQHGKRNGKRFSCRVAIENGVIGLRVWRLAKEDEAKA